VYLKITCIEYHINNFVLLYQNNQGREQIPIHLSTPFYHCSYQTVVVMFATIVKQNIPSTTPIPNSYADDSQQQLSIFLDTFIEFDRVIFTKFYTLLSI